jgi:protoheme IX farnesyltransferase
LQINNTYRLNTYAINSKFKDIAMLVKLRLSMLVVFSSGITYLFAVSGQINWFYFSMLCIGGMLTTGASNAINQVIEKDFDKLMHRTMNRPLPTERMNNIEALLIAGLMGVSGITILWIYFNQLSALFAALALLSYAFIYTPLKRFSSIAVFVGAIPGALPPLIGYVSATGSLDLIAISLFGIQFMWQFPHFWAIAWVAFDDYNRAGYKLLPSREGRNKFSALQNIVYILVLIPVSLLPFALGVTGIISAVISVLCGIVFLLQAIKLYRDCEISSAKQLMFGSFFYLPIVQLALYFDKFNL